MATGENPIGINKKKEEGQITKPQKDKISLTG
jgi:hypothetical protein